MELKFELPYVEVSHVEDEASASKPRSVESIHINELLGIVVDKNASDLHVCADRKSVV